VTPQHKRVGFAGSMTQAGLQVQQWGYIGDMLGGAGDSHPTLSVQTCNAAVGPPAHDAISVTPSCVVGPGRVCLDCNDKRNGMLLCGGG
jgi:hypothetical protein